LLSSSAYLIRRVCPPVTGKTAAAYSARFTEDFPRISCERNSPRIWRAAVKGATLSYGHEPATARVRRPLCRATSGLRELTRRQHETLIESFTDSGFDRHPAFDEHRVALLGPQTRQLGILLPSEQR